MKKFEMKTFSNNTFGALEVARIHTMENAARVNVLKTQFAVSESVPQFTHKSLAFA